MVQLQHVRWQLTDDESGRRIGCVGVRYDGEALALKHLAGQALPASLLAPVLDAALGPEWLETAEEKHRMRVYPWRVDVRQGMSGARDYRLRVLANSEWQFVRTCAEVHVSMYGKLPEDIAIWIGDVPPLLAAIVADYPPAKPELLHVYEPRPVGGFKQGGEPSGLRETLDSLQALEALSK